MSSIYDISGGALLAQRQRLGLVASNIANVDSIANADGEAYKAKFANFTADPAADGTAGVKMDAVVESDAPAKMKYRPGHPLADEAGYVEGSNVSLVNQMSDMINATQTYQANLSMLKQGQQIDRALIRNL